MDMEREARRNRPFLLRRSEAREKPMRVAAAQA
jgi:hypothetical protein